MKIRINCYDVNGNFKKRILNIKNLENLEFNEIENGGQGNFYLELDEKFDCLDYLQGDFIEYIIFDEKYKKGLLKFCGVIKSIERFFSMSDGQSLKLEIQGLVALLSDFKIKKNYSGNLFEVVNQFILDFEAQKNFSGNMQYLGQKIFKNALGEQAKSININVSVDGTFFNALENIFLGKDKEFLETRNFFINQKGEIIFLQEKDTKKIFTLNKNISEININSSDEIILSLINIDKNLQIGDKILIQNINKNLNLNGEKVKELAFGIDKIVINVGKILNYKDLKK